MKSAKVSLFAIAPLAIIVMVAFVLSALYFFRGQKPRMMITVWGLPLDFMRMTIMNPGNAHWDGANSKWIVALLN